MMLKLLASPVKLCTVSESFQTFSFAKKMFHIAVVCAIFIHSCVLFSANGQEIDWNYDDGPLGPDNWCNLTAEGNQCCGDSQSPIDIVTKDATETPTGYYFKLTQWDHRWEQMTLTNDGHTVVLRVINTILDSPTLVYHDGEGNPSDDYILDSLHFHFGGNDSVGAEHTIDGFRNAMEMHTVFYNSKYPSLPDAKNYPDGVVVVGVHFNIENHNNNLDPVIDALKSVVYVEQEVTIDPGFPLQNLYPKDIKTAYSYKGSLTTPICQEVVQWFVLEDRVGISELQISNYRELRTISEVGEYVVDMHGRRNVDEDTYMFNNFRPTQDLNGRIVYHHTPIFGDGQQPSVS